MKKYLIIFIAVMLLFMGVFGISYSNAKYKVVSIYNNIYSVVSKLSPLISSDLNTVPGDNVNGLGTYTFQNEVIPVMDYVLKNTGINAFIEKWNSAGYSPYILSEKDFKISDKMYLVHTNQDDYYCYRIVIDTNKKAAIRDDILDGVFYYNAYDGYFTSFTGLKKYKYLQDGPVFDSYINNFDHTDSPPFSIYRANIEETDWTVNEFVNTEKID